MRRWRNTDGTWSRMLAPEDDPASKARLEELRRELVDLRAEADAKRAQWEAERQAGDEPARRLRRR
ncbi:MAG: ATP-dependent Clp protease ATP-binding subunit ClpB [Pseudonocardiales bacterium]|nr:ATP-dependent Clp protease ATP-binding subunit ClpB [Pseudonocardiales bacterium]